MIEAGKQLYAASGEAPAEPVRVRPRLRVAASRGGVERITPTER